MKQYILDRLKEPSTWQGLVSVFTAFATLLAAFGFELSPNQIAAVIAFGASVRGLIGIFTKDKTVSPHESQEVVKQ